METITKSDMSKVFKRPNRGNWKYRNMSVADALTAKKAAKERYQKRVGQVAQR